MQCPKCQGDASDFNTAEGIVVNFCSGCKGLWFDQGELALYNETESDIPDLITQLPQAHQTHYNCPRCQNEQLTELPYMAGEEVLIDWCPACHGAWLDQQELGKIEALATRYENHTARLRRGITQLEQAGYKIMSVKITTTE
jgi:Zn-finger nucleic acid-binding protein